ncbi:Satratoxin biosynthesis SC21 cluster protein [Paramyrothecium foliicola]|nr:Satratoxin biosynthesis SC21 cluster protein [Paramyrothecium foliicola]
MVDIIRLVPVIVCDVIAIVAVALRFWCKHTLKAGYHGDDWWTLTTVISFIGGEVALLWGLVHGNRDGATIGEINEQLQKVQDPKRAQELQNFLKSIFIAVTISFFVVYAIKIAILLLYRRIFSTRAYKLASNVMIVVSTLWFIVLEAINIAHCRPIESFWTNYDKGNCINFNILFLAGGVIEIVIDVIIIIIPMVGTYQLHTNLKTKLLVSGIFLLGWFSIVTNILRVYYTYQPHGRFVLSGVDQAIIVPERMDDGLLKGVFVARPEPSWSTMIPQLATNVITRETWWRQQERFVSSPTLEAIKHLIMSKPRAISRQCNHVAVSVSDVDAVTKWYEKILGFKVIGGRIIHIKRSDNPSSPIFAIYGDSLNEVRTAYMATGNGVGFEGRILSYLRHRPVPGRLGGKGFEQWGSLFGVTVKVSNGGATCAYVKDPWGNVMEILDVSFDRMATMAMQ